MKQQHNNTHVHMQTTQPGSGFRPSCPDVLAARSGHLFATCQHKVTCLKCVTITPLQGCVLGGRALRVSPGCAQRSTPPSGDPPWQGAPRYTQHTTPTTLHTNRTSHLLVQRHPVIIPHLVRWLYSATTGPVNGTDGQASTLHPPVD
jgi:hypothetical protein